MVIMMGTIKKNLLWNIIYLMRLLILTATVMMPFDLAIKCGWRKIFAPQDLLTGQLYRLVLLVLQQNQVVTPLEMVRVMRKMQTM